jgi:hypothetical protein
VRLDVTGHRPWPGPDWDGFEVVLHGTERRSFLGVHAGEAVSWSEDGRVVYLFGMPGRMVTPPGRRERLELTELVIERIEVACDDSPARLVADFAADRLYLEIGDERAKGRLESLLGALRLLQLPPATGRRAGSLQAEDVDGFRARLDAAVATLIRDHRKVSVKSVAGEIGYDASTLSKKLRRLKIPLPR